MADTHYMVSVLVLDALEHVSVELAHHLLLLLGGDGLQRLLDHAAAVHLQRQRQHVPAHLRTRQTICETTSQLIRAEILRFIGSVAGQIVTFLRSGSATYLLLCTSKNFAPEA